jgi:hypothetical protein
MATMASELKAERELLKLRRRRGVILKLVRSNHLNQGPRMDDFEVWSIMQKMAQGIGRIEVITLLQDLEVLDYLSFKTSRDEDTGRTELTQIELTASGLRFMIAGRSNDDIELR